MDMNPLSNHLNRFFNRNNAIGGAGASNKKAKTGNGKAEDALADKSASADASGAETATPKKARPNIIDAYEKSKTGEKDKTSEKGTSSAEDTVELTPAEQRKKRLAEILEQVEQDYASRYPSLAKKDAERAAQEASKTTTSKTEAVSSDDPSVFTDLQDKEGIGGFINDMPLFNEFKTGLMDAFRRLDSASSGSISAQYELNYKSMQYIADEAGGYEYKEVAFNVKLDLNYVKSASSGGGKSAGEIADAIENAEDFEAFASILQEISQQQQAEQGTSTTESSTVDAKAASEKLMEKYLDDNGKPLSAKQLMNNAMKSFSPDDVMKGMQDYFSPEATAGRIVDFATMFFPLSDEFKDGGDTEETRKAFSERMGKAIQKGFDDAIGTLGGNYSGTVGEGVDKTHELVFKGLDDFVKKGMKPGEEEKDKQNALQQFAFSFEMNYSSKTTSVSYGSKPSSTSALNTQA